MCYKLNRGPSFQVHQLQSRPHEQQQHHIHVQDDEELEQEGQLNGHSNDYEEQVIQMSLIRLEQVSTISLLFEGQTNREQLSSNRRQLSHALRKLSI